MEVVSSVLNWFSSNILQNPAFFVGLLVLIGYALLKKPAHDVFSGFVKATVGYMLLNVGAGGLVTTFRPILAALNYKFQIGAAVIDPYFGLAAAILNNPKLEHVKFIGPYHCGRIWEGWGVPKERIIVVKPGDTIELKDMKIHAVESFDRTCLVTLPVNGADETGGELAGLAVTDEEMAQKAVNYIFETPGGTIYHGADSHFSNYFAKHGKDFKIDVALNNYGENPVGIQDKMTSIDLLRMAENLRTKVIIPVHYDIWSNFMASTNEILELWKMRKDRLQYDFHPFIWEVGGKYTYPQDQHLVEYHHPRGFDDCFEQDSNIQFKALL